MEPTVEREIADNILTHFETSDAPDGAEVGMAKVFNLVVGKVPYPATTQVVNWFGMHHDFLHEMSLEIGRNSSGDLVVFYRPLDRYKYLLRECRAEAVDSSGEIPVELVSKFLSNFSTQPFRWRRAIQRDLDRRFRVAVSNGTLVTAQVLQTLSDAVATFLREEAEAHT